MQDETGKVLGIQISPNKVFVAHLIKDKVNKYLVNHLSEFKLNQSFNHRLIFQQKNKEDFFKEIKNYVDDKKLESTGLALSFTNQAGLFKSVQIDINSSDEMRLDHLEWSFSQTTGDPLSHFSIALPDQVSFHNERIVMAMYQEVVQFSKELADYIAIPLTHLSMNILNFYYLYLFQQKIEGQDLIFTLIEDGYAEIAYFYSGMLQKTDFIEFENGINLNAVAIQLRNSLDMIKGSHTEDKIFLKMYLAGSAASISTAENLANAIQMGVELANPYENVKLSSILEGSDIIFRNKTNYAVCLAAALQG